MEIVTTLFLVLILGLVCLCAFVMDKKMDSIINELRQISHNTMPQISKPLPPQPGGRVLRKPKTINGFDDADIDNRVDEWIP